MMEHPGDDSLARTLPVVRVGAPRLEAGPELGGQNERPTLEVLRRARLEPERPGREVHARPGQWLHLARTRQPVM